jgi:phosphoheptose isomerase
MASFPLAPYDDAKEYLAGYVQEIARAFATLDDAQLRKAADCLEGAVARQAQIFTCGNGGSAAIANHFVCDHVKGARADTSIRPRVHSLISNIEIATAISNDLSYEEVFAFQLESYGSPGDVLVAISSSGNSPNIVRVLTLAKDKGMSTIAMVGFSGGKAKAIADIALHVDSGNYGVVEDIHQSLMHILAQFIRQRHMHDRSAIASKVF